MDIRIQKISQFRQFLLSKIAGLTAEQMNTIPQGYNNNIIWNVAHLICAQQGLCYLRAGQAIRVDEKYMSLYRTGTKPAGKVEGPEIEQIKVEFLISIEELQEDYKAKKFANYSASENIQKVYQMELRTIDDALEFLLFHEGYHIGYILALLRLVSRQ